jgi:hypothetical protein
VQLVPGSIFYSGSFFTVSPGFATFSGPNERIGTPVPRQPADPNMQSTSSSPYQEWLDRYAAGTISPADEAALLEAIARGQVPDADLQQAMHRQWLAGSRASTGALPFDKTALRKKAADSLEPTHRHS